MAMTSAPKPVVLQLTPIPAPGETLLREHFDISTHFDGDGPPPRASEVRGIATTGHGKATAALLEQLPALEIIACFSSGTDGIDRNAAEARGIPVTTNSSLIGAEVADLAMGLIVSLLRRLPQASTSPQRRLGAKGPMPLARSVGGSRIGIVGMGTIGQGLAERHRPSAWISPITPPGRRQMRPGATMATCWSLPRRATFLRSAAPPPPPRAA